MPLRHRGHTGQWCLMWESSMKIIAGYLTGNETRNGFLALNDEGDEWWIPSDKHTVKHLTTHGGILLLPSDYDFNTVLSVKTF